MPNPSLKAKLDAIFNAHMNAELAGDLDQTLATMAPNPHLVNVPTMIGGQGPQSEYYLLDMVPFTSRQSYSRFRWNHLSDDPIRLRRSVGYRNCGP